ncbi:hypothetical protein [Natranaerobius trueperi]|uniref:Uncharacterized protein n=1 Tax=Natranaerobius trueperi TaxID=759412 RepID=A0A226C178_9FIRM|nr:hypothetical protein [Natranaerobius trueperi]OWZ84772.1 hypothetical protein CDO51_01770 [Natranaerobius trueperi]
MSYMIIGLVIIITIIYFVRQKGSITSSREQHLRNKCKSLLKTSDAEAEKTLTRLIERQKERNPGKSEEWYLDKILYDLEKDK